VPWGTGGTRSYTDLTEGTYVAPVGQSATSTQKRKNSHPVLNHLQSTRPSDKGFAARIQTGYSEAATGREKNAGVREKKKRWMSLLPNQRSKRGEKELGHLEKCPFEREGTAFRDPKRCQAVQRRTRGDSWACNEITLCKEIGTAKERRGVGPLRKAKALDQALNRRNRRTSCLPLNPPRDTRGNKGKDPKGPLNNAGGRNRTYLVKLDRSRKS